MYKTVIILYLVVFVVYILFTRQPDYFDGEITTATIHWQTDSMHSTAIPKAVYTIGKDKYAVDARYVLRNLHEGRQVEVIYELARPEKGKLYSWWGYWISWGELVGSIVLLIALFQVAVSVTKNPTPESLLEQLEYEPEKKRKYTD